MPKYRMETGLDGAGIQKALGKDVEITRANNDITVDTGNLTLSARELTELDEELSRQLGIAVKLEEVTKREAL